MAPTQLLISLVWTEDRGEVPSRVLEFFRARPDWAPSHWHTKQWLRDPLDEDAYLAQLADTNADLPKLSRASAPRYQLQIDPDIGGNAASLVVTSAMVLDAAACMRFHALADELVQALEPEFALVNHKYEGVPIERQIHDGAMQHVPTYVAIGPSELFVVTYFGPRLLRLAGDGNAEEGRRRMTDALGSGAKASGSILRVAVSASACDDGPDLLRQKAMDASSAMAHLGLLSGTRGRTPGRKWQPPGRGS